jgi:DNA-binding transcriptional LysR family regulator
MVSTPLPVNLDLDLLRTFLAILDSGGFTSATGKIHRTQSTVSLHLRRLEELTGRELIERNGRSVRPTEDGELLRKYAENIIALNDEAYERVKRPRLAGAIKIGVYHAFATHQLPEILHRFAKAYPDIRVDVVSALSSQLHVGMANKEFDLCIAHRYGTKVGDKVLWREPLVWVAADQSVMQRSDPVPLVLYPEPCPFRACAMRQLKRAGRSWRIVYTCTNFEGIRAAVRAGLGVSALTKSTASEDLHILGKRDGLPSLPDTQVTLYYPKHSASAAVESLASFILASRQRA